MSMDHDFCNSAYAFAHELIEQGLRIKSVKTEVTGADDLVVMIAPDGTITLDAIDTIKSASAKPRVLSRLVREEKIAAFLRKRVIDDPDTIISLRQVTAATKIPKSTVWNSKTWKAYDEGCKKQGRGKLRTRQLTDEMVACIPNHTAADPAAIAEANDELERLIAEQKRDDESDRVL